MSSTATILCGHYTRPGHLLKAQIVALGVKLVDVAEAIGVSPSQLNRRIYAAEPNPADRVAITRAVQKLGRVKDLTTEMLWQNPGEAA